MVVLYEILVPTQFEDTKKSVSVRHHREWDKVVRKITNGLTILKPAKGQWIDGGELYEDRVIPVRIACDQKQFLQIMQFTLKHYRQLAIMGYKISDEVYFVRK